MQNKAVRDKQVAALRVSSSTLRGHYSVLVGQMLELVAWGQEKKEVADLIRAEVCCWTWLASAANACSLATADCQGSAAEVASSISYCCRIFLMSLKQYFGELECA